MSLTATDNLSVTMAWTRLTSEAHRRAPIQTAKRKECGRPVYIHERETRKGTGLDSCTSGLRADHQRHYDTAFGMRNRPVEFDSDTDMIRTCEGSVSEGGRRPWFSTFT